MHACSQFFMRTCMEVSAKDHLISVFLHVLIDLYRSINHFKQTKKKKKRPELHVHAVRTNVRTHNLEKLMYSYTAGRLVRKYPSYLYTYM